MANAKVLLGQTVKYQFSGSEYTGNVIDAGDAFFTVLDERGLRRVIHVSMLIPMPAWATWAGVGKR